MEFGFCKTRRHQELDGVPMILRLPDTAVFEIVETDSVIKGQQAHPR